MAVRASDNAARVGDPTVSATGIESWYNKPMYATRELTRDKIVEVALGPEWELADEGKPWHQPGGELLREDSPVEWLLSSATVLYACCIGQADCVLGVDHGSPVVICSAHSNVEFFEPGQTLDEIG